MKGAIEGFASRFYAFATKRSPLVRDLHGLVADEVLKRVSVGTVLDVGTGPGYLPVKIAAENRYLRVVGIDVSKDMVKMARRNVEKAGLGNVEILTGDVVDTGLPDESVDLAVATMSFHHWGDPVKGLNELYRVLKREGEVWIYEVDSQPTSQSEEWMKRNYNIILRLIVNIVKRHSSITVEYAERILRDPENKLTKYRIDRLEPPLIKVSLVKNQGLSG